MNKEIFSYFVTERNLSSNNIVQQRLRRKIFSPEGT